MQSSLPGMTSESERERVLAESMLKSLQKTTDRLQSTLFRHTWKTRTTKTNEIPACRATGIREKGNGCTSWPTPQEYDSTNANTPEVWKARQERNPNMSRSSAPTDLCVTAQLASWPTPHTNSSTGAGTGGREGGVNLQTVASWATPKVRTGKYQYANGDHSKPYLNLEGQVDLATAFGETPYGSPAETEKRGQLNPALSRWLMGLPVIWDLCALRVTPTIRTRNVLSMPRSSKRVKRGSGGSVDTETQSYVRWPLSS